MADRYRNFADLAAHEKEDLDFRIRSDERHGPAAVIAPHGGGIEPGTSELAEAIAGDDLSFCSFEGLKKRGNGVLHITSSRFDEPNALALVAASPAAVALHGELDCPDQVVFLGGLDKELGKRIQAGLEAAGLPVWLDHESLKPGDSFSPQIEQYITRECSCFIPIISATTERRHEVFFRREWSLAVERDRGIHFVRKFIVPVVIDDTAEPAAVPPRFAQLNYTWLPDGRGTPGFVRELREIVGGA